MSDSTGLRVKWLDGFEYAELYDHAGYVNTVTALTIVAMARIADDRGRNPRNKWSLALAEIPDRIRGELRIRSHYE